MLMCDGTVQDDAEVKFSKRTPSLAIGRDGARCPGYSRSISGGRRAGIYRDDQQIILDRRRRRGGAPTVKADEGNHTRQHRKPRTQREASPEDAAWVRIIEKHSDTSD